MVLLIATAGLTYELTMAAVASYLLGDSVTQFSLVIGVYLSALGLGAYLSRFIERRLTSAFIHVELAAALVGGFCAPGLFVSYAFGSAFSFALYASCVLVGTLVGLELPLLIRILRSELELKELIARALTFDYIGALVGSLAFSFVLVPKLGLLRSSLVCGILNALVGVVSTYVLNPSDPGSADGELLRESEALRSARAFGWLVLLLLSAGFIAAPRLLELTETALFGAPPIVAEQSRYQRIVVTERGGSLDLHLNGNLQFSSADERRYHEALVHPAMSATARPERVLIGGGGDGLAAREVFTWSSVREVTLVDLDPAMTDLFRTHPRLARLNRAALSDSRLHIVNSDALLWMSRSYRRFDVIILDFPDPSNYSLGKLYSQKLYSIAKHRLAAGGTLVVQATSPLFARVAYWCIITTLEAAGFHVRPYHAFVPSFGEWGYALAKVEPFDIPTLPNSRHDFDFLTPSTLASLFVFPPDMQRVPAEVNRLNNQALVSYYVREWARWSQ